jgi:hypothetical protein
MALPSSGLTGLFSTEELLKLVSRSLPGNSAMVTNIFSPGDNATMKLNNSEFVLPKKASARPDVLKYPVVYIKRVSAEAADYMDCITFEGEGHSVMVSHPRVTIEADIIERGDPGDDFRGEAVLLPRGKFDELCQWNDGVVPLAELERARKVNSEIEAARCKAEAKFLEFEDSYNEMQSKLLAVEAELQELRDRPDVVRVYEPSF